MRLIKIIFAIAGLSVLSTMALAGPKGPLIAEVIRIRGEATQLSPGALTAKVISIGDKFVEDTSILTASKSFLKIKFIDGSEMNIGPESKIVIAEMKKESPGVISLLKGRIRTGVKKDASSSTNKFYIKTRTAAMGVRGTEFQTIYNPDNKLTSLLTYHGEVAMARLDELTYKSLEEGASEKRIERNEVTKDVEVKEVPAQNANEGIGLSKILKSKQTVLVPSGQNSFASADLKKASLPVKISPVQLEVLYKNNDFEEKTLANVSTVGESEKVIKSTLKVAEQKAPLEGFYNEKTGDFAPKAGGFIDLATGLYVAPDDEAKLDKEKGVYISQRLGDIDADTGQYIAPKGLILDAKKGFVLASEGEKKPELLALREDLNKTIAKDIVIKDEEAAQAPFKINEKFIRDRLALYVRGVDQELKMNSNRNNLPFVGLKSSGSFSLGFDWVLASSNRFSPMIGLDYASVDFGGQQASQQSKKTIGLSFGTQFAFSKTWNLFAKIGLHQDHFIDETAMGTYALKKIILTRVTLGGKAEFWRERKFSVDAGAAGLFTFRKKINNLIVKNGLGLQLEVMPKVAVQDHRWIGLGLQVENQLQRVEGSLAGVQNKEERNTTGVVLKYIIDL